MAEEKTYSVATFGGGCFWCTEAVFAELKGVHRVTSGYSGGKLDNPTYEDICRGDTGHAEVIRIEYDPAEVSFDDLLEVFFQTHDPTTLNRQGNDVGTQYRSVIYYHDQEQHDAARQFIEKLTESKAFAGPIVTELSPAPHFYPAEQYHQNYLPQNPGNPYCMMVVRPKVDKFRKQFADRLK